MSQKTCHDIQMLKGQRKIAVLTAYDFSFARLFDQSDVDVILVGDSMGMVVYGEDSTKQVTMDDMVRHTRAVAKGIERACIWADMPINSFNTPEEGYANARRLIEAGAAAVKIEGEDSVLPVIAHLVEQGISVVGHVGLTPQTADSFKVQGKSKEDAQRIFDAAQKIESAGACALVLECIPQQLGMRITERVSIPTIGIGAGPHTDGQVLVMHDVLGLYGKIRPKFVRQLADLGTDIITAANKYAASVTDDTFPSSAESFTMNEDDLPT